MGTRSLTVVKEEENELLVMYRQMDGYPSGHGQDLANFLKPILAAVRADFGSQSSVAFTLPAVLPRPDAGEPEPMCSH